MQYLRCVFVDLKIHGKHNIELRIEVHCIRSTNKILWIDATRNRNIVDVCRQVLLGKLDSIMPLKKIIIINQDFVVVGSEVCASLKCARSEVCASLNFRLAHTLDWHTHFRSPPNIDTAMHNFLKGVPKKMSIKDLLTFFIAVQSILKPVS